MATGDGMLTAVMVVLSLNFVMFAVGFGITDLGGNNPFNYNDNALGEFNIGNSTNFDVPSDPASSLPGGGSTSISPDTGNVFTDMFTSIKEWLINSVGLGWVLNMLTAPKVLLSLMLPNTPALVWSITALWYGITLFIIVAFIWGR